MPVYCLDAYAYLPLVISLMLLHYFLPQRRSAVIQALRVANLLLAGFAAALVLSTVYRQISFYLSASHNSYIILNRAGSEFRYMFWIPVLTACFLPQLFWLRKVRSGFVFSVWVGLLHILPEIAVRIIIEIRSALTKALRSFELCEFALHFLLYAGVVAGTNAGLKFAGKPAEEKTKQVYFFHGK